MHFQLLSNLQLRYHFTTLKASFQSSTIVFVNISIESDEFTVFARATTHIIMRFNVYDEANPIRITMNLKLVM